MLYVFFGVWLLSLINDREIYPKVVDGSFSWLCSVPLCDYPPLSTLLLMGIWVLYILGYHKECCYEHCTCVLVKMWMYLCGVHP